MPVELNLRPAVTREREALVVRLRLADHFLCAEQLPVHEHVPTLPFPTLFFEGTTNLGQPRTEAGSEHWEVWLQPNPIPSAPSYLDLFHPELVHDFRNVPPQCFRGAIDAAFLSGWRSLRPASPRA